MGFLRNGVDGWGRGIEWGSEVGGGGGERRCDEGGGGGRVSKVRSLKTMEVRLRIVGRRAMAWGGGFFLERDWIHGIERGWYSFTSHFIESRGKSHGERSRIRKAVAGVLPHGNRLLWSFLSMFTHSTTR